MPNDRSRAIDVIVAAQTAEFKLGEADCFTLAMDVVRAVTGKDPYERERGRYVTMMGAQRQMLLRGFTDLRDAFAAVFPVIAPGSALLGDIGTAKDPSTGQIVGVVYDGNGWVGRLQPKGLFRLPISDITRAYRIC